MLEAGESVIPQAGFFDSYHEGFVPNTLMESILFSPSDNHFFPLQEVFEGDPQ